MTKSRSTSDAVRDIRGTNHLPVTATASHNVRVFVAKERGGTWDREIYRAEVDYIASKGLKQVRLFWSPYAYFIDKAAFARHVREAAEILAEAGLEVMLVCTDALTASAAVEDNPFLLPWYDLLGVFGSRSYDPARDANDGLMNGRDGLLDRVIARDRAAFDALYPRAERGYSFGGWVGFPDPTYVCAYEMPSYPAVPLGHEELWRGYVEALDLVIGTFQEAGVLHSLDLQNEPTVTLAWAPIVALLTEKGAYSGDGGLPSDATQYTPIAERRLARMLRWIQAYAGERWPDVPTTIGAVDLPSILYVHAALEVPVTSFFSFHSYGNGRYQEPAIVEFRDLVAANRPEWSAIPLCCSEYGRWEQGEDMLPFALHTFEKLGVGALLWDILEWPGFGGAFDARHVPGGAPPPGSAFPVTGLVRSKLFDGVHVIEERRSDLLPELERWARREALEPPVWWQVCRLGPREFGICDPRTGDLLPESSELRVLWRWTAVPRGSVPPFTESSPAWRAQKPFTDFRCLGSWLDVPHTLEVHGRAVVTLPQEVLDALPPDCDLVLQPSFGRPRYALDAWSRLQWYEVGYFCVSNDGTGVDL
ncbi:MAG: hypothetical protein JNM84_28600 [Planctomycetes bacterium]|nr:hypothetical protein [Planctomycetota bacterium]